MEVKHKNLRDVGLSLSWLRSTCTTGGSSSSSSPKQVSLPCGRLLRCGAIDGCSFEQLRRPATVINLRMGEEGHVDESLRASGVQFLHVPAENSLEKYDTSDPAVREWLCAALSVLLKEDVRMPVLYHCRSGKDRTGVVVAALLHILNVPDSQVVREFLLSKDAQENMIRKTLAGFRKSGSPEAYFEGLDLGALRKKLLDVDESTQGRWLQQEVNLMCRLAREFAKQPGEESEATYWREEVSKAAGELASISPPSEAAAALCYQGWALSQLQRYEEAMEPLTVAQALSQLCEVKPQVLRMLEKELEVLPDPEEELEVVEIEKADETPGNPHAQRILLCLDGDRRTWQQLRCPRTFSWLRCGELAACVTPKAQHLEALNKLGLSGRVSAESIGAPKPPDEHWEDVVGEIAKVLCNDTGCVVHCVDGFGASGVALACFLVVHGLDEPIRTKPGQPRMTAGEAIEVLRAMRPGVLARDQDEEQVHSFATVAWGKHVERVQRAFGRSAGTVNASTSTSGSKAEAAARPSPAKAASSGAKVVHQPGDGNCLFHSMAYGLGQVTAASLRTEICAFMEKNPDLSIAGTSLADWIQMLAGSPVAQYAKKMAKSAQWGGAPEIAACAHMRKVNIHVYERRGAGFELTVPFDVGGSRTVAVLYTGGVHYDALVL